MNTQFSSVQALGHEFEWAEILIRDGRQSSSIASFIGTAPFLQHEAFSREYFMPLRQLGYSPDWRKWPSPCRVFVFRFSGAVGQRFGSGFYLGFFQGCSEPFFSKEGYHVHSRWCIIPSKELSVSSILAAAETLLSFFEIGHSYTTNDSDRLRTPMSVMPGDVTFPRMTASWDTVHHGKEDQCHIVEVTSKGEGLVSAPVLLARLFGLIRGSSVTQLAIPELSRCMSRGIQLFGDQEEVRDILSKNLNIKPSLKYYIPAILVPHTPKPDLSALH